MACGTGKGLNYSTLLSSESGLAFPQHLELASDDLLCCIRLNLIPNELKLQQQVFRWLPQ